MPSFCYERHGQHLNFLAVDQFIILEVFAVRLGAPMFVMSLANARRDPNRQRKQNTQ